LHLYGPTPLFVRHSTNGKSSNGGGGANTALCRLCAMNWTVSDVTQTVRLTPSFCFIVYFYISFRLYQVPLYFHTGYLLSFFALFPFSFQSSVPRSTLFFFFPHFFFIYSFSLSLMSSSLLCPSSCLIICLSFSIFFLCVCTFISRFLCCFFLLLFAYIFSFFHTFLFLFTTTHTESLDTV